ncbi:MAG: WcaF family extracellular polysaccharide biosynthesis acetyltransferase [Bacteroidia bacterium]|nr:WcaF family extracellular polysaccharide biosynthesis acetyltransferase [Bacteroidia bacterium]
MKVDLGGFKQNLEISGGKNITKRILWHFVSALFFQTAFFPVNSLKVLMLKAFGAKIGKNVNIKPFVYFKFPWRLIIGNNVWIGERVWIANEALVRIGNNVCISHETLILSGGHNYKKKYFDVYANPVIIEDGVWLGAQSSVGGGITIGSHAVLTMKSVANNDLEPYSIYRGNPAIKIRDRIIAE